MANTIQTSMYYNADWTESIDKCFLQTLADIAEVGNFQMLPDDKAAIRTGIEMVKKELREVFTVPYCFHRMDNLYTRYSTFTRIINSDGVSWDKVENIVYADETKWTRLIEEMPMARAYKLQGDPEWKLLCQIFDPKPLPKLPKPEIQFVTVSSDSEKVGSDSSSVQIVGFSPAPQPQVINKGKGLLLLDDESEDESVNSPSSRNKRDKDKSSITKKFRHSVFVVTPSKHSLGESHSASERVTKKLHF